MKKDDSGWRWALCRPAHRGLWGGAACVLRLSAEQLPPPQKAWHRLVPRPGVAVRVPCLRKKQAAGVARQSDPGVGGADGQRGRQALLVPGTRDHGGEMLRQEGDSVLPPLCKKGWQQVCSWRPGRGHAVTRRGHWSWHDVGRAGVCFGVGLTGLDHGRDGVGGCRKRPGGV